MDVLKQLAPLYRKDEELSFAGMDDSEFLPSDRVLYLCISTASSNFSELSSTLTSTMKGEKNSNKAMTQEEFEETARQLIKTFPRPPVHTSATGTYAKVTDIPPILMCESNMTHLFEELLYSNKSTDELVNAQVTSLIERFLYMRPETIPNSYVSFLRECHSDTPPFQISPRSVIFANSKLDLNETYPITFTIKNNTNTQQIINVIPIANVEDMHFTIDISDERIVLKRKRTATFSVSIRFSKSSTKLSKLILLSSDKNRDFINISATSKSMVFGVDPSFLPSYMDNGYTIPLILTLLKQKLIELNGLTTKGIFRISCSVEEGEKMIAYINENGEKLRSTDDLPITDVNVIPFLIKYFYRSFPILLLNHINLSSLYDCKTDTDYSNILNQLPSSSRRLLEWFVHLMAIISNNSNENGMGDNNCARMIAPSLFTVEDISEYNRLLPVVITFCESLIRQRRAQCV